MYKNKVVLITGASSGLGKNLAINYAKHGAQIINLSRNKERMEYLQQKLIYMNNINHKYFSIDVSKYDEVLEAQKIMNNQGIYPNIIINNAAGNFLCPFHKLSSNGWNRIIDIVLNGSFNIYHTFGNEMIQNKRKGIFLNISTTYSETGSALVIPSAVAKSGVDNMIKGLTVEWAPYDIRLVGIAPGPIHGSGGASKLDPFSLFKYYNQYANPRKRMCSQDEISKLSLYLTSSDADYINGEIVKIDGGETCKNSGEFNFITNIPFYQYLFHKSK
jgi:2,4-dienoyl-CoA reductase